ncbi:hypothetical protein niasHT_012618 [Heterodera trifolii]|uniref:Serpin domain-containing protein n=1 Tax=Heterodera trifolii TaxID=157864 RepID=A0ABD2L1K6_9BILA
MMHKKDDFIYFEDDQLQLLGMPYQGENVFMFVMLSKERFGLAKMLAELDGKKLLELTKKRGKREVQVVLPKFKLESTHQLNKPLANMGMATAFSDSANFEGIANGPLKISEVVQKAYIENNEEGSEAAAATAVVMMTRKALVTRPKIEFVADRPFYFTISVAPAADPPRGASRRSSTPGDHQKMLSSDAPGELHAQGTTPRFVIAGALASKVELPPGNRTTEMILRSTVSRKEGIGLEQVEKEERN